MRPLGAGPLGDGEVALEHPDDEVGVELLDADPEDAVGSVGPLSRSDPVHFDHLVGRALAERVPPPVLFEVFVDDLVRFRLQGVQVGARRDLGDACSTSLTCTQRHQKQIDALLDVLATRRLGELLKLSDLLLARDDRRLGRFDLGRGGGAHLVGQGCNCDNPRSGGRDQFDLGWRDFVTLLVDRWDGRVRLTVLACYSLLLGLVFDHCDYTGFWYGANAKPTG